MNRIEINKPHDVDSEQSGRVDPTKVELFVEWAARHGVEVSVEIPNRPAIGTPNRLPYVL